MSEKKIVIASSKKRLSFLLKREKITQEPASGYITVLDAKARRLKQLTDDLLEASKISSGNITLDTERHMGEDGPKKPPKEASFTWYKV